MERWVLLLVAKFISLINEEKISDTFLYLSSYPSPHVLMMMPQECTTPQEGGIFNKILLATRYSVWKKNSVSSILSFQFTFTRGSCCYTTALIEAHDNAVIMYNISILYYCCPVILFLAIF